MKCYPDRLFHHGIPGQRWGVRRYQNEDGSLTEEGKRRYLGDDMLTSIMLYNDVVDRANIDLKRINKKYNKVDLVNDDRANLAYTKEVRDSWQKNYRDVLAKDLETDPSKLIGQKWLDDVFGYRSNMDKEIEDLEKKVKDKEQSETKPVINKEVKSDTGSKKSISTKEFSDRVNKDYKDKYLKTKMSQQKAIDTLNDDLEAIYPNFFNLPESKQNELFILYVNESGLYKWL